MSGPNIQVDIATLRSLHGPFVNAVQQLDDAIGTVNGLVQQIEACWHGAAADAFMQTNAEWHSGITTLFQSLQEIEQRLKVTGDSYADLEAQLQRMNTMG